MVRARRVRRVGRWRRVMVLMNNENKEFIEK